MDDYSNGGLSVLLRYMNVASPVQNFDDRQDWVALRAVAELAYLSGALQTSQYPLLRTAASCGYLRSTDTSAGLSHPLLFQLSHLGSNCDGAIHAHRKTLVEEFVEGIVASAQGRYPNLEALSQAASASASSTPMSRATPPPPVAPIEAAPLPSAVAALPNAVRYPALAILGSATHPKQHLALTPFIAECEASTRSPFESIPDDEDDDDIVFTGDEQVIVKPRNTAFLFTKPHAFGRHSQQLVESEITKRKLRIDRCGVMGTERIDREGLIDKHYAAIARYACTWAPKQIQLPPAASATFEKTFGENWAACVDAGRILNASQAAERYGCASGADLAAVWGRNPRRAKLCPGLYAGLVEDDRHYILNGFYLANREKFTAPRGFINWYVVSWEEEQLPWAEFRGQFVGPTNPADAPPGSLRGIFLNQWRDLGLSYAPTVSDNGVHASAGPLEGLAERLVWLPNHSMMHDVFGRALMRRGVAPAFIQHLLSNPEVTMPAGVLGNASPKKGLVFDLLEDVQSGDALEAIYALQRSVLMSIPATGPLSPFAVLRQSLTTSPNESQVPKKNSHKAVMAMLDLAGYPAAPDSIAEPTESVAQTQPAVAAPAPMVPTPPPTGPSSLRPRPVGGRAVSSPYQYDRRNSGAGLERVFRFTLQHVSSRRFASTLDKGVAASAAVESSFLGLRALHAAVISIKKETAPDPYVQVTTTVWAPTFGNAEQRRAMAHLPPVHPPKAPVVPRPPNTDRPSGSMISDANTSLGTSARARLSTAERIKRRTSKLQQEIAELNKRHEARTQVRIANSPRKSSQQLSPRSSPRQSTQQQQQQPNTPKRPTQPQQAPAPGSGSLLPSLNPERVSLASIPVKPKKH